VSETINISIDDAVLVEQYKGGDSVAMERLIVKYQNRIYNVILKICTNVDDAAELTQDTFVKVLEKINTFQGKSSLYTWMFRIAVNLTLNYCKRNVKLGAISLDAENYENVDDRGALKAFLTDKNTPDPSTVASNKELCELVTQAIAKLDDDQRAVVVLRDIEGMNYEQMAQVLDIELGTVKSRLSRARSNLREILEAILR